jgi:hypothetical protein
LKTSDTKQIYKTEHGEKDVITVNKKTCKKPTTTE